MNFGRVLGGAMVGFGEGLIQQGMAKREEAMRRLQHEQAMERDATQNQYQMRRDETQFGYQTERDQAQHGMGLERDQVKSGLEMQQIDRRGMLDMERTRYSTGATISDRQQEREWRTGENEKDREAGKYRRGGVYGDGAAGVTPSDERLLKRLEEQHTKEDYMGKEMDRKAIADSLIDMGRSDLAAIYDPSLASGGSGGRGGGAPRNDGIPSLGGLGGPAGERGRSGGAQSTKAVPTDYALAPSDPTKRTKGEIYRNANGILAEWTGSGWRIKE